MKGLIQHRETWIGGFMLVDASHTCGGRGMGGKTLVFFKTMDKNKKSRVRVLSSLMSACVTTHNYYTTFLV